MTTRSSNTTRIIKIGSSISTALSSVRGEASIDNVKQLGSETQYSLVRVEQLDQTAAVQQ
jgi:hypothetical protein